METAARHVRTPPVHRLLLVVVVTVFALVSVMAMRQTSTTFDEILLPAAGARGFTTGNFGLVTRYHPPVLQYVYGLPVALGRFAYPAQDSAQWGDARSFRYARAFYFESGNDPQRIAFLARLMAVAIGIVLILTTFLFTRTIRGSGPALLAAVLVAFVPDVLAHSGISYNDVALALVVFVALWAADTAIRDPRPWRAALCGGALGLALGVKFSAIALGPAAMLLLALEAAHRWPDREWTRRIFLHAAPVVIASAYLALVVIYRGDLLLEDFRSGLDFNIRHAAGGHTAPAVLLGRYSTTGWWYFFPVAFFLKTSAGLHMLIVIGLAGILIQRSKGGWRSAAGSPLRAPAVGALVFLAFLMAASLNIGFRHALPILPLLCVIVASAISRVWTLRRPVLRMLIVLGVAWHIAAPMRHYPFFISYLSEYTGPVERSYTTLVDSSLDWGQGLLALREFMDDEHVPSVLLGYFGSALPAAYGISYVALPSYFPLPDLETVEPPRWVAISATNLAGNYFVGDPFAGFRNLKPDRVVGGSIFLYRLEEEWGERED
jgi:hypothetical protein